MAKPITSFAAEDGTIFPTEAEADAHDLLAGVTQGATEFVDTLNYHDRWKGSFVNVIAAWELHRQGKPIPAGLLPEPKPPKKPKEPAASEQTPAAGEQEPTAGEQTPATGDDKPSPAKAAAAAKSGKT